MSDHHDHEHEHKHHDDDCDCGHDHHDNGAHEHDHGGHDHKHSPAEEFVESALKQSARRVVLLDAPTSAKAIAAQKMATLSEIAERVAFEDIILGHIKALIDFGEQKVLVSITRLDECKQSFDWDDFEVSSYIFTVNVLSLHNADAQLDDLMERLLV